MPPRTRRFAPGLRRALSGVNPQGGTLGARAMTTPRVWANPGQAYDRDWDVNRAVEEGFKINPYIFRAVSVRAQDAASRQIRLRRDDARNGPFVEPEDLTRPERQTLYVMNRWANPWEPALIFRHRVKAQQLLNSRGAFVEVVRGRNGVIWGQILLDPDRVEVIAGPDQPVEGFRYTLGAAPGGFSFLPPFDPESDPVAQPSGVLWLRHPHPTSLVRGMSPMEAAALTADMDRHARLYNRRFLANDGRPGGVLSVKGPVSDEQMEMIKARFDGGPETTGNTLALESDVVSWVDTSNHPRDTQWGDTMDRAKKDELMAFGVPESVAGDASNRTFDNADAELFSYWTQTMKPDLLLDEAYYDILTPGGKNDNRFLVHDISDVYVLGREQRAEEDRALVKLNAGGITIDEYREVCKLTPLDVPGTRVLWVAQGKAAIDDGQNAHDGDAEAAASAPLLGTPAAPDPGAAALAGAQQGAALGGRVAANNLNARDMAREAKTLEPGASTGSTDGEGEQRGARAGGPGEDYREDYTTPWR